MTDNFSNLPQLLWDPNNESKIEETNYIIWAVSQVSLEIENNPEIFYIIYNYINTYCVFKPTYVTSAKDIGNDILSKTNLKLNKYTTLPALMAIFSQLKNIKSHRMTKHQVYIGIGLLSHTEYQRTKIKIRGPRNKLSVSGVKYNFTETKELETKISIDTKYSEQSEIKRLNSELEQLKSAYDKLKSDRELKQTNDELKGINIEVTRTIHDLIQSSDELKQIDIELNQNKSKFYQSNEESKRTIDERKGITIELTRTKHDLIQSSNEEPKQPKIEIKSDLCQFNEESTQTNEELTHINEESKQININEESTQREIEMKQNNPTQPNTKLNESNSGSELIKDNFDTIQIDSESNIISSDRSKYDMNTIKSNLNYINYDVEVIQSDDRINFYNKPLRTFKQNIEIIIENRVKFRSYRYQEHILDLHILSNNFSQLASSPQESISV